MIVVKKSAAGQVTGVTGQLPTHPNITLPRLEAVDGANVVESAACHIVSGLRIRACHYPTGA